MTNPIQPLAPTVSAAGRARVARISRISRRPLALAIGVGLLMGYGAVFAQNKAAIAAYPSKAIHIIVSYAPGGATDAIARVLGDKMSKSMGVPVVVDNKPGAGGIIGTDATAKAAPDGYTISLALSNSVMTNQFIYPKLPYDSNKDLSFIYKLANGPLLAVHTSVPAKTAPELAAYLKANPGKVSFGSYGQGSYPHMAGEYLSKQTHSGLSHVAYKGEGPMMQDLLGGSLQFTFGSPANLKPHIDTGKLRAIGVTGDKRFAALPQVPTLAEQGWKDQPYQLVGWFAFIGPAGMPRPIQDRLAQEIAKALSDADVKSRLTNIGYEALTNSGPDDLQATYKRDLPHWKQLVQISGARVE